MKSVIFANGQLRNHAGAAQYCQGVELIIAVDGGARHCKTLNILPHVLLGDLDSIPPPLLQHYEKEAVEILRYPSDKDKSDLELGLDFALQKQSESTTIFGALGLRWDMSLANLLLPAAPCYAAMEITLIDDATHIHLLRGGAQLSISALPGTTVSLVPLSGSAAGISLTGFKYPLHKQSISHGSTRGVSNVLLGEIGEISLVTGLLLCIVDNGCR